MRILLDLDSIIVNLQDEWYRRNNERFGDNLKPGDVTAWEIDKFSLGGSEVFRILDEPGLFISLPPLPGAVEGVNRLVDAGHDVYIVSAAVSPAARAEKPQWVEHYLPKVGKRKVILTWSKHVVCGDVLFDDGPKNLREWHDEWRHKGGSIATIAYPYNAAIREQLPWLFVAGDYKDTETAWVRFTAWVARLSGERASWST